MPWEEGDGLEAKIVLRKPENHRSSAFWMKAIYGGLPQLNIKAEVGSSRGLKYNCLIVGGQKQMIEN